MVNYDRWVKTRVLITARTYPVPSQTGIEVSCTAGVTEDGHWIRLFPIPFRRLEEDKRFAKYQYIEAEVTKSTSDPRPESYKVNLDSIKVVSALISPKHNWEARKVKVFPLRSQSLCGLQTARDLNKQPTLGLFRPKSISGLRIEPTTTDWTPEELARLRQYPLFGNAPKSELEKIPYIFKYDFICDEPNCHSHTLSCTDWEMSQSYRSWKKKYGTEWEQKFRHRYEYEMMSKNDTHFYVGTLRDHPDSWIIIGLFYPPKEGNLLVVREKRTVTPKEMN